jgi:ABC-type uncharacterized transport system auxiliary subunit
MMTKFVLGLALCVPLCACTSGLFTSKIQPTSAYLLSVRSASPGAAAGDAQGPGLPVDLAILKPRMRPGLESGRIAALYPDRRLEFYAGGTWSGSLDDVLQNLTVQMFQDRSSLRSVSGESTRFVSNFWLELYVHDFEAEYGGSGPPTIKVRFAARLGSTAGHDSVGNYEAQASQTASEDRLGPIVDAFERAANEALGKIVESANATLRSAAVKSEP